MIRLGRAAGYLFDGPRLLGGWLPPRGPAVYVIMYRLADPSRYAVVYTDHADDVSTLGFPFHHRHTPCWTKRAGDKWKLHVAWFVVPGDTRAHRDHITAELISVYHPPCNGR